MSTGHLEEKQINQFMKKRPNLIRKLEKEN